MTEETNTKNLKEPDKIRCYKIDDTKVTVNFYAAEKGKTVEETIEDFIAEMAEEMIEKNNKNF